jgi:hypothetical protein
VRLQPLGHLSSLTSLAQREGIPEVARRENVLAILCALVRFAFCCYRAACQSVVGDEAITYNQFVRGPWLKLFGRYNANNHVLSSILIKLSVKIVGLSPFKLRLPSLIAGFLLTLGVFWLLKQVKSPLIRWLAFAVFCLNPMLLDFSIAARGYSLSLAFFVWALSEKRDVVAGILLGLAIASNLAIAFAVLAVLLVRKLNWNLILPAILVAAIFTAPSLRHVHREDFYLGYPAVRPAIISFVSTSLHATDRAGILGDRDTIERTAIFILPAALALLAAIKVKNRLPLLIIAITICELLLAHWIFGINYPADRTCLYFIILAIVSWALAGDAIRNKYIRAAWLMPFVLLAIQFSTQIQARYFQFWQLESQDNLAAELIQRASIGKDSVTVSTSWIHQPALEFYRRYLNITALQPVERIEPTPLSGFDFYVLSEADIARAKDLRTVYHSAYFDFLVNSP